MKRNSKVSNTQLETVLLRSCFTWLSASDLSFRQVAPGSPFERTGTQPELIVTRNKCVIARAFDFQEKLEIQTFRKHCLMFLMLISHSKNS